MSAHDYLNFDFLIETAASGYRSRVLAAPVGEAIIVFTLPFAADELQVFLKRAEGELPHLHLASNVHISPALLTQQQFGARLFSERPTVRTT